MSSFLHTISFSRQPMAWVHMLGAILAAATAFGFGMSADQSVAVMAVGQAVAVAVSHRQVTPNGSVPASVDAVAVVTQVADAVTAWKKQGQDLMGLVNSIVDNVTVVPTVVPTVVNNVSVTPAPEDSQSAP